MRKDLMFCSGLLMGLFVGWILGILWAPQAGRDTRSALSERATELKGRAEQAAGQAAEQVRQFVRHADESADVQPA